MRAGIFLSLQIMIQVLPNYAFAQGEVKVDGYYRSDGTYVAPHYRTKADATINNNWTTKGNVNPYTGQQGWIDKKVEYPDVTFPANHSVSSRPAGFEKQNSHPFVRPKTKDSTSANLVLTVVALGALTYIFIIKPIFWTLRIIQRVRTDKKYVANKVHLAKSAINHEFKTLQITLVLSVILIGVMGLAVLVSK